MTDLKRLAAVKALLRVLGVYSLVIQREGAWHIQRGHVFLAC